MDESIVDFYDMHVAPMANTSDTREKTTGTKDSKGYKLQSIRKMYFRYLAAKDLKDKRTANAYDWAKKRYDNKLEFYNDVKVG